MGVKKVITRALNLVYLAGAGVAVLGLATQPVLSLAIDVAIPGSMITDLVKKQVPGGEGDEGNRAYRVNIKRDGIDTSNFDFMELLGKIDLDGVFEGLSLTPTVELPSLTEFLKIEETQKPLLVKTVVEGAINKTLDTAIPTLVKGFEKLVPEVAKVAAKELALGPVVKEEIAKVMSLQSDDPEVQAKFEMVEEKIDSLVGNVWDTLTEQKTDSSGAPIPTTVEDVMDTVSESINEVFGALADAGVEGFTPGQEFDQGSLDEIQEGMTQMLQQVGLANEQGEIQDMNAALSSMLSMLGGLLGGGENETAKLSKVTNVRLEQREAGYIVWDTVIDAGSYDVTVNGQLSTVTDPEISGTLNEGENTVVIVAKPADGDTKHQASEPATFTINVVEGVPQTPVARAHRAHRDGGSSSNSDEIETMVRDLIEPLLGKLPLDSITNINLDEMVGIANMTMYAYIGLVALASLPWLLFALVTLIRTLRKRKCWTKPWIVFFFAFLEVILGAGLYLGLKYGLKFAIPMIGGFVPEPYNALLDGVTISFRMHCLWASYVYLAMIPFTIIYAIFAHGPKKEFKQYKRDKKAAKKAGLSLQEYLDQKNGNSVESEIKTSSTKKEAKAVAKVAKEKK